MSRAGADNIPNAEKVLGEDFRAEYPDIEVAVEPAPDGWIDKLLAQMIAGEAVDIFQAWGNIFYNWTDRDLLELMAYDEGLLGPIREDKKSSLELSGQARLNHAINSICLN